MAVSNKTIINKMIQELNKAQIDAENDAQVRQHIEHVKLLCDLVLDEKSTTTPTDKKKISAEEMKAMMGHSGSVHKPNVAPSSSPINHEDANGKSIFDF